MAGRGGRGRGRSQMTFNVEAVGIGKGDSLPPSTLQPSPLFPPMEYKPVPLQTGEEVEYMLALKQELRGAMKNLPYYVKPAAPKKDVERYSDKYQMSGPIDNAIDWNPDWRRLPRELKIRVRKLRKERTTILIPKHKQRLPVDKEEAIKKLETLEKKEEEVTSEEEGEKEEEEEGKEEEEEEYDEEEHEEVRRLRRGRPATLSAELLFVAHVSGPHPAPVDLSGGSFGCARDCRIGAFYSHGKQLAGGLSWAGLIPVGKCPRCKRHRPGCPQSRQRG
ncbi:endonuclease V [Platysternon megacephalum]|uniref:Endonuclease V n=1 Tax=Platysternon megacephalum TaxID=55544 RepID=A0A4D9EJZ0_9SAUR|nr:endonuclease V [Platysternon megacephalum]